MLQISNLQLSLDENPQSLEPLIMKKLRLRPGRPTSWKIVKESLDARKKPLRFVYTVLVETPDEAQILKKKLPHVSAAEPYIYQPPHPLIHGKERPVVVGFGPCGMFAALLLAEAGLRPIVLERGADVDQRVKDVEAYWQGGPLNPQSNVQFGEGGAGTFSDGKLTTRVKDVRIVKVTDELIEAGADPEIGYQAHPHIGTDRLRQIVKNIRLKIQRLGGEVRFNTPMTGIFTDADGICAIQAGDQRIACRQLVLALGHSARDTFTMLHEANVAMEAKDFAVGVRVEHPQKLIDQNQYKEAAGHPRLKSAEYRLTCQTQEGRGVYSFCMCPGGTVVASASEDEAIVTNGMSEYARDQANANSALLVQVRRSDFGEGVLDGMRYQQELEHQSWILGGRCGKAPCQRIADYLAARPSCDYGTVIPSYSRGVTMTDLHSLFSPSINRALAEALLYFDQKIPGFIETDALMTGVETRSSSPVRILRDESFQSLTTPGLYPAGEGAGYAGGIVSAAIDGLRVGEQILRDQESTGTGR